jgi:hypothetical protein
MEDAGVEPRTVATLALTARQSNHSARSPPPLPATLPARKGEKAVQSVYVEMCGATP